MRIVDQEAATLLGKVRMSEFQLSLDRHCKPMEESVASEARVELGGSESAQEEVN
jgi:hypothetical protein